MYNFLLTFKSCRCIGETGSQDVPYFIIGSLAITAALANMLLPETQGRNLPDTYEEAEALQRYAIWQIVP